MVNRVYMTGPHTIRKNQEYRRRLRKREHPFNGGKGESQHKKSVNSTRFKRHREIINPKRGREKITTTGRPQTSQPKRYGKTCTRRNCKC